MVSGAKKGEVTAYLSLIFILFISFVAVSYTHLTLPTKLEV